MKHETDRRMLLRAGLGLAGLSTLGEAAAHAALPSRAPTRHGEDARERSGLRSGLETIQDGPALVLVQLSGGNDGLATVVPHGDDAYHRVRKATRRTGEDVLELDAYRGLNSRLVRLFERYQEGGLAIVEGVGYPHPNRSHFKSYEIWHTADARGRNAGDGWIGKLCEAAFGEAASPNRVVHVGEKPPYSLHSRRHPAATFTTPAGYRWVKSEQRIAELDRPADEAPTSPSLALLRERMREARSSAAVLRAAAVRYRTPVEYPEDEFASTLRTAAALLNGGAGTRVLSVKLDGFDTHNDERNRHDRLMGTLDAGLAAFLDDLQRTEVGRQAVVLVFSEFGRRVTENASGGTDHGTAGPMFVAGGRVRGGLYGRHPSLTELDGEDLVFTTDFRSVYAEAIRACFAVDPRAVLGAEYPVLGWLT